MDIDIQDDVTLRKNVSTVFPEYTTIDSRGGFRSNYNIYSNEGGLNNHPR